MTYEFTIPGRLPGMNEYISAMNRNRYAGAKLRADSLSVCRWHIMQKLKGVSIKAPVRIHYIWYESNRRRDLDNVAGFGHKVIQDALVECGVLKNDGWKHIKGYTDTFAVDRDDPHIVVMLEVV